MADKSKLGMEFSPYTFEVEKGKIAEFAMAISQKEDKDQVNPLYVNREAAQKAGYKDIIAPPTFQTCFPLWAGGGLMPIIQALGINLIQAPPWRGGIRLPGRHPSRRHYDGKI